MARSLYTSTIHYTHAHHYILYTYHQIWYIVFSRPLPADLPAGVCHFASTGRSAIQERQRFQGRSDHGRLLYIDRRTKIWAPTPIPHLAHPVTSL
eukprot:9182361-Pyramimonas_sp.AAC.1